MKSHNTTILLPRIGYLYTYWGPLGFVISVALIREAIDDFRRYQRDKEVNAERYTKLVKGGAGNGGSKILVASSGENFLQKVIHSSKNIRLITFSECFD